MKRTLSILLALVMTLSMFSFTAFASYEGFDLNEIAVEKNREEDDVHERRITNHAERLNASEGESTEAPEKPDPSALPAAPELNEIPQNSTYTEYADDFDELEEIIYYANADFDPNSPDTVKIVLENDIYVEYPIEIYSNVTITGKYTCYFSYVFNTDGIESMFFVGRGTLCLDGVILAGDEFYGLSAVYAFDYYDDGMDYPASIILTGCEVKNFEGNNAPVSANNSYLRINGGSYHDNISYYDGGAVYAEYSTVDIIDGEFYNNSAIHGGAIAADDSQLNIKGGEIRNNFASYNNDGYGGYGGGIYVGNSLVNIDDCEITGNSAFYYGGGVYLDYTTTLIKNSKITGNKAVDAGGIECDDSWVVFENTNIDSNTAEQNGGGVGIYDWGSGYGAFAVFNGGSVSNNIAGNDEDGFGGAIFMYNDHYYDPSLTNKCSGLIEDVVDRIADKQNAAVLSSTAKELEEFCEDEKDMLDEILEYFEGDFYGDYPEFLDYTYKLYLNGCTVEGNSCGNDGGAVCSWCFDIYVNGGSISNNFAGGESGAIDAAECRITLVDAVIEDNISHYSFGGVYLFGNDNPYNALTIYGGSISGNESDWYGGGIAAFCTSVTIGGGAKIEDNYLENDDSEGGGVYLEHSEMVLIDGSISNNRACIGGGIFLDFSQLDHNGVSGVYPSSLYILGGEINDNYSMLGGGVCTRWKNSIVMSGGEISGNEAELGGGMYVNNSNLEISGGKITGNEAVFGGGVYAENNNYLGTPDFETRFTMKGKPYITGNKNYDGKSDNVLLYNCHITLTGRVNITAKVGIGYYFDGDNNGHEYLAVENYNKYKPLLAFLGTKPFTIDYSLVRLVKKGGDIYLK